MKHFADWLASTDLSSFIGAVSWLVPAVQSIHILALAVISGALLMLDLRVLGWAGTQQSVAQVTRRFSPWIWGALVALAATGTILIIGEPRREFLSVSFWVKMALLAIGSSFVIALQRSLKHKPDSWEESLGNLRSTKVLAVVALVVWVGVIFMGRFIAWDGQIWGVTAHNMD